MISKRTRRVISPALAGFIVFCLLAMAVMPLIRVSPVKAADLLLVGEGRTYATITAAIAAAGDGDTIIVCDGVYEEDFTISGLTNLTIESEHGSGSTTIIGQTSVTIDVTGSDNFTLGGPGVGFTIKGTSGATTTYLLQVSGQSGVTIEDNVFDTTGDPSRAVSVGPNFATDLTVQDNSFTMDAGDTAVYLDASTNNLLVDGNTITGPADGDASSVNFMDGITVNVATISNNTITGATSRIQLSDVPVDGITYDGNTFSQTAGAILVEETTEDPGEVLSDLSIIHNQFGVSTLDSCGFMISSDVEAEDVDYSTVAVNDNNFEMGSGNTNEIVSNDATGAPDPLNASSNWWGDASGPTTTPSNPLGTGDDVSANVDYCPWLDAPGGNPRGHVQNEDTGLWYCTIQGAIDAAANSETLTVYDGTYEEDLTIDGLTDLTIQSANGAENTTIIGQDGIAIEVLGGSNNLTLGGDDVGFTIQGTSGSTTTSLLQITGGESGVTIEGNVFDTTGDATVGISVDAAGATGLTIADNAFIAEDGDYSISGQKVADVTVSDNIFTGPGGFVSGYAVNFYGVTGTSFISRNIITGYGMGVAIFNGEGTSGLTIDFNTIIGCTNGIRLGQGSPTTDGDMTTVEVKNNALSTNTIGLRVNDGANVLASNFVIDCNNFSGNTEGLKNEHATEVVNAAHNWWGDDSGPTHTTNPEGTGDEVSDNVIFCAWLDAPCPCGFPIHWVHNETQDTYHCGIQDAIDEASNGDTLVVYDGIYREDLVINGLTDLTIKSANGSGSATIIGQTGVTIDVMGGSDNFTLGGEDAGFTIQGTSGSTTTFLLQITAGESGVTIEGNVFDTTGDPSQAISVGAAGATDLTIQDNTFTLDDVNPSPSGDVAIDLWGPITNLVVDGNTITGPASGDANSVKFTDAGSVDGALISDNTITGATSRIELGDNDVTGITYDGNTFSETQGAILVIETTPNCCLVLSDLAITHNQFAASSLDSFGFMIFNNVEAADVDYDTIVVNYNNFEVGSGNTFEVVSNDAANADYAEDLNAILNWWGDASGPYHATTNPGGTGDDVSDNVGYCVWLGAPYGTTPMTFIVDDVGPSPAVGCIQTAIDEASAGDTVMVLAGTYDERPGGLDIDVAGLQLIGAGKDDTHVTLKDFDDSGPGLRIDADDVLVDGFDFDNGRSWVDGVLDGNWPDDDGSSGPVIRVGGDVTGAVISNNKIHGGWRGVALGGGNEGDPASDCVVEDNEIFHNDTGVWIDGGDGNVVQGNEIYENGDIENGWPMSGIALCDSPEDNRILGNHVYDNARHGIELWGYDTLVQGNTVEGNGLLWYNVGGGPAGISVHYSGNVITSNIVQDNAVIGIKLSEAYGTEIWNNLISGNGVATDGTATGGGAYPENSTPSGILLGAWGTTGTDIIGNFITDNTGHGIFIVDNGSTYDNVANWNSITGNTVAGVTNEAEDTFDATYNWWGHASGPYHQVLNPSGTGAIVSDRVDHCPWLDAALPYGDPLSRVHNETQDTWHCTIQGAIDAASPGDVIVASAGTYYEAINIPSNKTSLTILSADGAADIEDDVTEIVGMGGDSGYDVENTPMVHVCDTTVFILQTEAPLAIDYIYPYDGEIDLEEETAEEFEERFNLSNICEDTNDELDTPIVAPTILKIEWANACTGDEDITVSLTGTSVNPLTLAETSSDTEDVLISSSGSDGGVLYTTKYWSSIDDIDITADCWTDICLTITIIETNTVAVTYSYADPITVINANQEVAVNIDADGVVFGRTGAGFLVTNSGYGIDLTADKCLIEGNIVIDHYIGIYVDSGGYNIIFDNIVSCTDSYGIKLRGGSHDNTVAANEITNNGTAGIKLNNASNNLIGGPAEADGNTICYVSGSNAHGILLESSAVYNTISHNEICGIHGSSNAYGVRLSSSPNNSITDNAISDVVSPGNGSYGIYLTSSGGCTIADNDLSGIRGCAATYVAGIRLSSSSDSTVEGNTISSVWSTTFAAAGIWLNSTNNSTVSGNTISDVEGPNRGDGIYLDNSDNNTIGGEGNTISDCSNRGIAVVNFSDYNTIADNGVSLCDTGIYITNSSYDLVANNTFFNNTSYGIHIYDKCWHTLMDNTITGSQVGIFLEWTHEITTWRNTIADNGTGIEIDSDSYNNPILGNVISGNTQHGILLAGYNNWIMGNDIRSNEGITSGIHVTDDAYGNEVHLNNIAGNTGFGVFVEEGGEPVNAQNNWWGDDDDSGPYHDLFNTAGTGNAVSYNVIFQPWLTSEANVVVNGGDTYYLADALALDDPFSQIQVAIDDASAGDTLVVHPGLYLGQVHVPQALTGLEIISTNDNTIFSDGCDITIIGAMQRTDVNAGPSADEPLYPAVWIEADNVVFGTTTSPVSQGFTVHSVHPDMGVGILVSGPDCVVEGNDIGGSMGDPLGVFITGDGTTVQYNEIHGNDGLYLGDMTVGGILVGSSGNHILNNEIWDNDGGIILISAPEFGMVANGNEIAGNDIHDNGEFGIGGMGADDTVIQWNDIYGHEYAIYLVCGCTGTQILFNEIFDNGLGIGVATTGADDTWIKGNIIWDNEAGIEINESPGPNTIELNQLQMQQLWVTIAPDVADAFDPAHYQYLRYAADGLLLTDLDEITYKFNLPLGCPVLYLDQPAAILKDSEETNFMGAPLDNLYLAPYIVIELDTGTDGVADAWVIEARYGHDQANTWKHITLDDTSYFWMPGVTTPGTPETLDDIKTAHPDATVLGIKVALGGWAADQWAPAGIIVTAEAALLTVNDEPLPLVQLADPEQCQISGNGQGISIDFTSANTISQNSICGQYGNGLAMSTSGNNQILANLIAYNGGEGMSLYRCNWNDILDNVVVGNEGDDTGITLDSCNDNTIAGNTISGNLGEGIRLSWSYRNTIGGETEAEANVISSNMRAGIALFQCGMVSDGVVIPGDNTIRGNTISGNGYEGVWVHRCFGNDIGPDNEITGNNNGIGLRECGDIVVTWDPGCGDHEILIQAMPGDNRIFGNLISQNASRGIWLSGRTSQGMQLYWSCVGNTIEDNVITENGTGIYDEGSYLNVFRANTISDNEGAGIYNTNASWEMIGGHSPEDGNLISGNQVGVWIYDKCEHDVIYNTITGNTEAGILLEETWGNAVANNTISGNGTGIELDWSWENGIVSNRIENNGHGLWISGDDNQILRNIISGNTGSLCGTEPECGVYIDYGYGNRLHWNNITGNTAAGSYGVYNSDYGWVDARWNWWGDATGPYHPSDNPFSTGDAVSCDVDFWQWAEAAFSYESFPFDLDAPILMDGVATPDMVSATGMTEWLGCDNGFTPGPDWTIYFVNGGDLPEGLPEGWVDEFWHECPTGLRWVVLDRADLVRQLFGLDTIAELEQIAPPSWVTSPGEQEEWRGGWLRFLEGIKQTHMDYEYECGGAWYLERSIYYLAESLGWFFEEELVQRIHLGEFQVPVTLTDWMGNQTSGEIALAIVDAMLPVAEGWNLRSTPMFLEDGFNQWGQITQLGADDLNYEAALRWNSELQEWEELTDETVLRPLEAIAILASGNDQLGLVFSTDMTAPPAREVNPGWNLTALSVTPPLGPCMPVRDALCSIGGVCEDCTDNGARGYVHVLSIAQDIYYEESYGYGYCYETYDWYFEQDGWFYTQCYMECEDPCSMGPWMGIGGGYWVFSEITDTLAGFGTTPIPDRWFGLMEYWGDYWY